MFKQGDTTQYIYIVKRGVLELIKETEIEHIHKANYNESGQLLKNPYSPSKKKSSRIALIEIGEILGDVEAISEDQFSYSCKGYSTTSEILYIQRRDFVTRTRHEDTLNFLNEKSKLKETFRNQIIEGINSLNRENSTQIIHEYASKTPSPISSFKHFTTRELMNYSPKKIKTKFCTNINRSKLSPLTEKTIESLKRSALVNSVTNKEIKHFPIISKFKNIHVINTRKIGPKLKFLKQNISSLTMLSKSTKYRNDNSDKSADKNNSNLNCITVPVPLSQMKYESL